MERKKAPVKHEYDSLREEKRQASKHKAGAKRKLVDHERDIETKLLARRAARLADSDWDLDGSYN